MCIRDRRGIHRPGAPKQQNGDPVAPGIEDGHACVLYTHHVVKNGSHRLTRRLSITMCKCDRDFLVAALYYLYPRITLIAVSYTHLRAHETDSYLVCRLLLEKKKKKHEAYTHV